MTHPGDWSLLSIRKYVLTFLVCTLSVTVLLKVGEIQYLELILAADFLLVLFLFARDRFRLQTIKPFFSIGTSYVIFLVLVLLLAVVALRGNFYSYQYSFFKRPILVTLSRMAELFVDTFYMLYMASLYRADDKLCAFAARTYYGVGILGGIYALLCLPLNLLFDLQLGAYLDSHRLRGFNNEGGSYGTYLLSLLMLSVAMYHRRWLTRKQFIWGMVLFSVCLLGSQSKGAFFALVVLAVFHVMWSQTGWRRWGTVGAVAVLFVAVGIAVDIPRQVQIYVRAAKEYQKVSNIKWGDGNYVAGRIAGAVLGPRMIAAHPLTGIGWGNYPLVRDDPAYRQGSAFSLLSFDAPSLGAIDYIVDFG